MAITVTHYSQQRWTPQYIKLLTGMRLRELRGYLKLATSPRRDKRHILIYAQGRSGTTLLASLLASTGYFTDLGEPLHLYTREVWLPACYLRGVGRGCEGNVIAHVKGSQLKRDRKRPTDQRAFLEQMISEGWTIVYLHRQGVADQVLSECLALKRGAYHKTEVGEEDLRIQIDPGDFIKRYERRLQFTFEDRRALEGLDYFSLNYEDDLMDARRHQVTADRILTAVGLPAARVCTNLQRIGVVDRRDRLYNYEEINSALRARGISWDGRGADAV